MSSLLFDSIDLSLGLGLGRIRVVRLVSGARKRSGSARFGSLVIRGRWREVQEHLSICFRGSVCLFPTHPHCVFPVRCDRTGCFSVGAARTSVFACFVKIDLGNLYWRKSIFTTRGTWTDGTAETSMTSEKGAREACISI